MNPAQAAQLPSFLRLAATRGKHMISGKDGETVELKSNVPNALIYVENCKNCEAVLEQKAVKVIVEGCSNCVFNINNSLLSGTMEFLRCENITLNLQENGQIMTLTAEDTNNFKINAIKDDQLDIIYIFHTTDVEINIEGDNPIKFPVVLNKGPEWQYVIQWLKEGEKKILICERVIREGVYPTTERQLKEALETEKEFSKRMATALVGGIKVSKPPAKK